jgi:hypothetical protein
MGFFTPRERAELGESLEPKMPRKIREQPIRRDFAPRRTPRTHEPAGQSVASQIGAVMQRVSDSSLQEIDDLIAALKRRREKLLSETARMQREIIEYAKLNQSTMQSAKVITESLGYLKGIPDAPQVAELAVEEVSEEVSNEDRGESLAEASGQPSEDHGASDDQAAEAAADPSPDPENDRRD